MSALFAGLDVSQEKTAICVVDAAAIRILETEVRTDPTDIANALRPLRRRLRSVAQETGSLAPWLHKGLLDLRFPAVCIDARATRAALRAQRNKTDKNDARDIATLLSRGLAYSAHVKSDEAHRVRFVLNSRRCLIRKARDIEATLKAALKGFGLTPDAACDSKQRGGHDPLLSRATSSMMQARRSILAEIAAFDRMILEMASGDPICRRLMTAPGVGPVTALTYRAGVDDPMRFTNSRLVGAHFGLTPRRIQSGKMDLDRPISKFGDVEVRTALYSAAMVMLVRCKANSRLREWGLKIVARRGHKVAATACARKLAVVLHRMWIAGADFEPFPKV